MAMCSLHLLQQAKQGTLFVHPSHQWFVIQLFPKKKKTLFHSSAKNWQLFSQSKDGIVSHGMLQKLINEYCIASSRTLLNKKTGALLN